MFIKRSSCDPYDTSSMFAMTWNQIHKKKTLAGFSLIFGYRKINNFFFLLISKINFFSL